MRKNVRFIIAVFIVFGILAILVPASEAVIRIMPLGDSITRGFSGSTDQVGYRQELYLTLFDEGYDIDFVGSLIGPIGLPNDFDKDHEGHSGFTSSQIAANVYDYLNTQRLAGNPADIVLLHIGTNDITVDPTAADVNDVAAILDAIDDYEVDFAAPVWVILARIINRNCLTNPTPCLESDNTTIFNNNVAVMAQDRIMIDGDKILIVDMENGAGIDYNLWNDIRPGDMSDNLHPFDTGYEKMADLWFSAIQQVTLPVAAADADPTTAKETTTVTLDGSNSDDPDGTITDYLWEELTTTGVVIDNATESIATFTAPDVDPAGATLIFRLTVTDNDGFESSDSVSVDVVDRISPVAVADADPTNPKETTEVTLDGTGSSDADGTIDKYLWEQLPGGTQVLPPAGVAAPMTTFTAPLVDSAGMTLTFRLTVTDDDGLSDSTTVDVTVVDRIDPVAVAVADPTNPKEFTEVTLDGSESYDPDGAIDTYLWEQLPGGTRVMLTIPPAEPAKATFTAPAFVAPGETLTFRLTVTDDDGLSGATVNVNVSDGTVPSTDGGGGGGGGGCFIAAASDGVPLKSYITGLGNIRDQSMIPGNLIFTMILFALCLGAGICLKYALTVQWFRGSRVND